MDKQAILQQLISQMEHDLAMLVQSALAAKDAATHTESKAEDQYDTRGLEASYLAGAQAGRVQEMEQLLKLYRALPMQSFGQTSSISITALVELQTDAKTLFCLLMPKGGGRSTVFEGRKIQVTTPESPLGEGLMGKRIGDEVEVRTQVAREYEIVRVW